MKIQSLKTHFFMKKGILKAVDGVDLEVSAGETVALVGESGCGKTVTALSIFRLISPPGRIVEGRINFRGQDLLSLSEKEMNRIRGMEMGLILQDSMAALNPVLRVGEQIAEVLRHHLGLKNKEAKKRTLALMEQVRLPAPEKLYRSYAHELSGGQRQRVLIAIALACKPSLIIADEPTTALDVSIQSQILALLQELKVELQLSLLLITHDLGIVSQMADGVAVMYAGKIVEQGSTKNLLENPLHPYTRILLDSLPQLGGSVNDKKSAAPLNGSPPDLMNLPAGCAFHPRCPEAETICTETGPDLIKIRTDRYVRCLKLESSNGE